MILLVEDDALVSLDLADRLARLGFFNIVIYETGEEAIENFTVDQPKVVIMDIALAGELDGIETAIRLKKETEVPIIFLTDNVDENTFQRSLAVHPAAFLHKPFIDRQVAQNIEIALLHGNEPRGNKEEVNEEVPVLVSDGLFAFKKEGRFDKVPFDSIRYLEAGRSYCKVYISGKENMLVTHSMKIVFEILKRTDLANNFVQIHRSYIVNTSYITGFQGRTLYLDNDKLTSSDHFIPDLRRRFFTI